MQLASSPQELVCYWMTVLPADDRDDISAFTQLTMVFDLATPMGCKAELT